MQFVIAHNGIPIGLAELPHGRSWAGGLLDPLPSFDSLRPTVRAAAVSAVVAHRILTLPRGEEPATTDLAPSVAEAVRQLARFDFELRDAAGLPVPAEVVRIADAGDGKGIRVRAYFRAAGAPTLANVERSWRDGGGSSEPGA